MGQLCVTFENGESFKGTSFGSSLDKQISGEACFTTSMTGYTETLSDPSYAGQIVAFTHPTIGSYGFNKEHLDSDSLKAQAMLCKSYCKTGKENSHIASSHFHEQIKKDGVIGISHLPTRKITRMLRKEGVMNAVIHKPNQEPFSFSIPPSHDLAKSVVNDQIVVDPTPTDKKTCLVYDFGVKYNILYEIRSRGLSIIRAPFTKSLLNVVNKHNPSTILISNGPGDPNDFQYQIEEIKQVMNEHEDVPIFGICLGHQLMALATGHDVTKMKYGHRGINHPVYDKTSGKSYITTQNHGYCVMFSNKQSSLLHTNLNDDSIEGLSYETGKNHISVQFHPEACAGTHDTKYLFDIMC